jgi:O-Antigen ligase
VTSHTLTDATPVGRRSPPLWSAVSLLLPLVAMLAVAAANGGYFATAFGWAALAFAWVTIVAVLLVAPRWGAFDAPWLLAGAALCVFTFCSAFWAGSAATAVDQGQRAVVYATAVAGTLVLLRHRDLERWLLGAVLGAAAICFYSLATRLFADHFGAFNASADYRLFVPIGYWNALGIFAGCAALLALGVAVVGHDTVLRVLAAVALIALLPTLYYTYSRGSWAALLVGVIVAMLYSPWRERLFIGLFVFGSLPAVAVWLASRPPALTNRSASIAAASHDGHRLALELAALGGAQAIVAALYATRAERIKVPRPVRIGLVIFVAAAVCTVVIGVLAAYGSPSTIAHRTYHAFTGTPTEGQNLNSRLFSFSNNGRIVLWRAAWSEFRAHPVDGGGAGSFQRWWLAHRTTSYQVVDAHNLYAQTLGELGAVGAALLAVFLGLPLVAAVGARRHPLAATALGAYAAYLVHCIVDWDWQMPAVTLLALFAGAALVVAARGSDRTAGRRLRRPTRIVIGLLAALAAAVAFVGLIGNIALARSGQALLDGNARVVVAQAQKAHRWAPWSAPALRELGEGRILAGSRQVGLADIRRAAAKDPGDWETWFDLASATSGRPRALSVARVRALNPAGPELDQLEQPPPTTK